jgi:alanine-glyoxylate transaminase/serine-glyoxylate transaminase/serine-pyruvate transaminase
MRTIWRSPANAQPFLLAGSGTLSMEVAVWNTLDPGQRALVVGTGYFSDRLATMLRRRGVDVISLTSELGHTVPPSEVAAVLEHTAVDAVCITHVDTSTGVRADVAGIAKVAKAAGKLVLVDAVCATAGEALDQGASGVDVYLTASQKALGGPPGLALLVASPDALEARANLAHPPPLGLDFEAWAPVMQAYEAGKPSYFATPATSLVNAMDVALQEVLSAQEGELAGVEASWARHARVANQMRAAWAALGCALLPDSAGIAANTLSAVRYPAGVGASLPSLIKKRGVIVAGGLHPKLKTEYFRVGHMGWVTSQPALLKRTVQAIGEALVEAGHPCDPDAGIEALKG